MADLLQRVPLAKRGLPLMVEIPVHPESAPFLVSGTRNNWVWIPESKKGVLRSAFRDGPPPDDVFFSVAEVIAREGRERKWGNVTSFTEGGLKEAVGYLKSYGFDSVEVLVPKRFKLALPTGVKAVEAPWMRAKHAVVVPSDRSFLGILGSIGEERHTVVVHNPSRGMALIGGW